MKNFEEWNASTWEHISSQKTLMLCVSVPLNTVRKIWQVIRCKGNAAEVGCS